MTTPTSSLAYRKAALQHASTVGLVIALYDTLLGNLGRAVAAMERNDIEGRCAELIHGFKVLQQLELMLDMNKGGPAALNLRRFYMQIRAQMLAAQFKVAPALLRQQIKLLIEVREAWQQVDARGTQHFEPSTDYIAATAEATAETSSTLLQLRAIDAELARPAFSCSG